MTEPEQIYAIRGVDLGRIKIGVSRSPVKRLANMQIGSAELLELMHALPCLDGRAAEKYLHATWNPYRIRGEWFQLPEDILVNLPRHMKAAALYTDLTSSRALPIPTGSMNYTQLEHALQTSIRQRRGAQAELARRLGISTASVAAFIAGGNRIPPEHIDTILDILGADIRLTFKALEALSDTEPYVSP